MILLGHSQAVADWVARINGKPFHPPFEAIGIIDGNGTLTGGFVFTGFNGDSVELSLAGRGVASRDAWRVVLDYVFNQLGCSRMQMHTNRRNKKVKRNLHEIFGEKRFEGIAKRFYGKDDGIVFALTVDTLNDFKSRWRL